MGSKIRAWLGITELETEEILRERERDSERGDVMTYTLGNLAEDTRTGKMFSKLGNCFV